MDKTGASSIEYRQRASSRVGEKTEMSANRSALPVKPLVAIKTPENIATQILALILKTHDDIE